jgi:autotransporter-associated beta strand protein
VAPTDGQYNNAANWVGGNIPASSSVGTLYTATFGTSSITTIAVAAPSPPDLYVGSFQFNAGASAYTFNVADGTNLRFHGAGIVNNSSNAPTFNLNGSSSNLWLGSAAKAGNAIINITNGGDLLLGDTASAENAVINVTGSNSAGIEMFGGTLGDATVTLSGDGSTGLVLRQTASGGSARVIANGGSINIVNLTGAGTTLGSLAGASTSFNVNLGSKQLTVGGNNDSTSFAGRLNGSGGSIGKAGTGTWTLTNGTHTYDGLTTISGGTLALSGNGNLANSSGIALTNTGTTFDISAANGNRTIKDLSGVAGSAVALGARTLSVGTANDTTFAGDISGTGGLTKLGSGTLTLSGSNAYTGATTITDGTLALSGSGNIGASSGVNLTGATARFDISASGGSTAIKSLAGVAGSTVNLGANSLAVGNATSTTFAGVIDGSGGLIKQGTGTLTLTAVNTYAGATQINGGTLALSGSGSIALSNSLTLDGTGASTVFDISQTSGGATIGSLFDVPSGPPPASTAIVRLGSKTLTITELMVFAGTIADGGIDGGSGGGLTIAGVGGTAATAALSGTNTYTGATTIGENATLELDDNGSISNSSGVNLTGAGAVFDISCGCLNPQTIKDLQGVSGTTVRLGNNSLTVGTANSTTFEGVIDAFGGTGGLIKQGSGTLTLGGANTYTGETVINAGTLKLTNADAIATSSGVTVAAGAALDVSGTSGLGYARVQTLAGSGAVQLGDSGLEITNGSTEFSGAIVDGGNVGGLRISGGTLTLSGISTYTNLTEIQQGATLALKGAGSIAGSSRIEFKEVTSGVATFDISQTDSGASVVALVENRSAIGVVALGSKELTLTGTATDFQGEIQDGGIGGGTGGKLTLASGAQATLRGFNTYTGATTINDGATLKLADFGSIHESSVVDLAGVGALFDISGLGFGGVATIRNLAGNGTVKLGGSALELSQASGEFAGKIIDDELGGALGGEFVVTNGSLTLTGQSTYTGMTAIGGGATLFLKGTGSIDKSLVIYFDPRGPSVATFDISQTASGASVQGLLDFGGLGVVELGSKTLTVTALGNFVGIIQGAGGGLTLAESAQLGLGGVNTYTGVTTIGKNATLALFDDGSIAASSAVRLIESGATLDISCSCGGERTVQNLEGVAGSLVRLGANNLAVVSSVDTTFAGIIAGGPGVESTTGGLIKQGNGTLTLSGSNTYTGGTAINGGAISISSNTNLGAAAGTLAFGGGTLRTTANISMFRATTLNAGGGTFDVAANTTLTQNGVIGGDGGLSKAGAGTLVLGGTNTYTGGTTINAGVFSISSNTNLGAAAGTLAFGGGMLRTTDDISMSRATTLYAGGGTFDVAVGTTLTQSGIIDGSGNLTKIGAGTLQLTVASTYVGDTMISAGTLALAGNGNISSSNLVTVASGATLQLVGSLAPPAAIRNLAGNGTVQFLGRGLEITNASGEFAGSITGNGSLTLSGGTMTLTGASTYSGSTTIAQGATLALKGTSSVPSPSFVYFGSAGGSGLAVLDISQTAAGVSVGALDDSASPGSGVVNLGSKTLILTRAGGASAVVIQDGGLGGGTGGGVTLAANAQQRLAGINTYTGVTTVGANATLWMTDAGSIALSSRLVLAAAGAVFDTSNSTTDQTIQDLEGVTGSAVRIGGTLAVGTSNSTTFAGVVAGAGNLTKQGGGTLTLSSINTYTGATTITGGTLALSGAGSIAASSGVNLAAGGARFDISGANGGRTIQDLTGVAGTSVVLGGNSLTVGTANSTSFAGNISGTGGLTKQGSGRLTLTGTNTYSGVTTVSGGTLAGNTTSLQGNITNNAAVVFDQSSDGTYAGNMSGSGSLTKTGSGNLTLSGTNTYTGDTTVSAGTLTGTTTSLQGDIINNAAVVFNQTTSGTYSGVMSGTGALTKIGTGTVILTASNTYSGITTISDGVLQLGNGGTTGMIAGNVVVNGADSLLAFNRSDTITFAGDISGTGGIMLMGPGTVALTGNNTFSGGTAIGGGIIQVASDAAFGAAGTTLKIGGGATVQALASFTSNRPVGLIGMGGTFDTNGNMLTLGGPITGGGALTKIGAGTLILTGTNSYSGGTTVEAGTVQGNSASLQGAITNNASVVFDQGMDGTYAGAMSGTGSLTKTGASNLTLTGVNSYVGGTTVSGGTLTGNTAALQGNIVNNATVVFNQATNGVYAGAMSGNGALVKTGTGNLTLTGANSYTGGTTVSDGTLTGNTTSLQGNIVNNATVVFDQGVSNGVTLGYDTRLLSGSGGILGPNANGDTGGGTLVNTGAGTLTIGGANTYAGAALTDIYGGAMSSGSTQAIAGAGTLTLSGTNTYSSDTTVSSGTLTLTGSNVFATGTNGLLGLLSSIYAGAMSGSGALVKTGNGNLTLTGANSYTGGTTVSGGILIGTTSSLQGGIVNNATVAFDQGANGTYDGAMSGSGALLKSGAGNVTLKGANSYTGGTTVFQGTLTGTTSSLQGNIVNNAAVVFDQASNGVYAGVLSGSGTLTKAGAGLLNLAGNSVVGGGTTVSGGTLAVNGSLTSNVTVGAGGAIGGTGIVIGALTIGGGTLAPGNSIGTLNVTGNFTQTGGVYQVEANAGGQSDKIVATGTATISGGTTVQVLAASGIYQRSTTYTILSATGGLTGTYGGVTSNLAFLTPSLSYDANNAFLTLELLQNAFSFGGLTPNQRAVGRTLDTAFSAATGDFATVLTAMMGLSTAQGPAVLDTISGQPYASFGTVNVLANLLFMNTVGQQMALARTGGPGATRVALAEACEVACDIQEPPRWGAWFSGLGGAGNVGGNYNAGGLTYNLGGAAVGVDYRFDPRFLVGFAFGYSSGRQWVSGFQGLGTTDNYSAVLYASFTQGGFYADALAGYAYSDNRQQRVMQIPGLSTRYANGGTGANQFLGQIEAGYKIGFGLTETAQASVTPFARFQTVAASQKGFSEWGADSLNLNVQQQNTTSIRTVLGADLAASVPLGTDRALGITLRLGWAHDYGDTARPMTAAFAGAPTVPFTIVGAQPMRDSAVVGFGLSTRITDSISAYARYDGELNGRDDNHNFSAGFRMTW